jgi:hypothetical protein
MDEADLLLSDEAAPGRIRKSLKPPDALRGEAYSPVHAAGRS